MGKVSDQMEELDFESLLSSTEPSVNDFDGEVLTDVDVNTIRRFELNRELSEQEIVDAAEQLAAENWDLMNPVVLIPDDENIVDYIVMSGEKRWRAFKYGGQKLIKARIREDLTPRQAHRLNIKANTETVQEDLPTYAKRLKVYKETYNVSVKEMAEEYKHSSGYISDYINHLWKIREIDITRKLHDDDGVKDMLIHKHLIMIYGRSESAARSIVAFGKANNCFNRDYVLGAYKMSHADIEQDLMKWYAAGLTKEALNEIISPEERSNENDTRKDSRESSPVVPISTDVSNEDSSNSDGASEYATPEVSEKEEGEEVSERSSGLSLLSEESHIEDVHEEPEFIEVAGGACRKRALAAAEISVEYQGSNYFLDLNYVSVEEDKIVIVSVSGDKLVVSPSEVNIGYVS
ncbi:hypothetical protein KUL42_38710 [Alteromonas sp. KUL42]|uniref:ParB N-terminal domain-containing protein n=1 Tax=Alteromonas sp. KUL42 TaxID=2480797 RepID=UPI001035CBF7|nr:ParB N-terminal domain-containing protein [Alteromonas sp. KUL42]TAP31678.1 hypothetical protein EYR97_19510 [Alteromonas sp. KUL42]GEA09110.1 hypothetical protein KUL42_38710 [Alteromonas sp. KUL42]